MAQWVGVQGQVKVAKDGLDSSLAQSGGELQRCKLAPKFWPALDLKGGFTHRPNRPWPRAPRFWGPRATLSYNDSILTKNLQNCAHT